MQSESIDALAKDLCKVQSEIMPDYSQMTQEEFDSILEEIVDKMSTAEIIMVSGIYELMAEELNNEVLNTWVNRNESKAYPKDAE